MDNTNEEKKSEGNDFESHWKKVVLILAPYSIAVGCLNLMGYWHSFGVNVFVFGSIPDIVASALPSMIVTVLSLLLMLGIASPVGEATGEWLLKKFPDGPDAIAERAPKINFKLVGLITNGVLCAGLLISDWEDAWLVLPSLIALPFVCMIAFRKINVLPFLSEKSQYFIISFMIILMPIAYAIGNITGTTVVSGRGYYYVVSSNDATLLPRNRLPETALRYIGHVGEYDFYYDPLIRTTTIARVQKDSRITVFRYLPKK